MFADLSFTEEALRKIATLPTACLWIAPLQNDTNEYFCMTKVLFICHAELDHTER